MTHGILRDFNTTWGPCELPGKKKTMFLAFDCNEIAYRHIHGQAYLADQLLKLKVSTWRYDDIKVPTLEKECIAKIRKFTLWNRAQKKQKSIFLPKKPPYFTKRYTCILAFFREKKTIFVLQMFLGAH